jgi:hypothetical protein
MENQNPKYARQHQERKVAEFNALARSWITQEQLSRMTLDSLTLSQQAAFMVFDYFMSTGGEDEVRHLISFLIRALETVAAMYWDEPPSSNN